VGAKARSLLLQEVRLDLRCCVFTAGALKCPNVLACPRRGAGFGILGGFGFASDLKDPPLVDCSFDALEAIVYELEGLCYLLMATVCAAFLVVVIFEA
jgi:hypothetical protein